MSDPEPAGDDRPETFDLTRGVGRLRWSDREADVLRLFPEATLQQPRELGPSPFTGEEMRIPRSHRIEGFLRLGEVDVAARVHTDGGGISELALIHKVAHDDVEGLRPSEAALEELLAEVGVERPSEVEATLQLRDVEVHILDDVMWWMVTFSPRRP